MTIRRVLAIALSAGLLLTAIGLSEFHVYAQDADGIGQDAGAWSGSDTVSGNPATDEFSDGQESAPWISRDAG
jgi:hypothetical protein